jgi:small nuclear ribonucleoprotein (snRNP)-like protein
MSSAPDDGRVRGFPLPALAILVVGLAIAVALFVQALRGPESFRPAGAVGSLQTVTLSNGQVYFGRLKAVEHASIVLTDVFEGVTTTDPKTQQRNTQLVSRRLSNWHGPLDMAIPVEKILFTETVGPDSAVGKAMAAGAATK